MKSAKERAAEVCRKLGLPEIGTEFGYSSAYHIILQSLQEHEQDTRQACAEAIRMLPNMQIENTDKLAVESDEAWLSCMNAKVE